MRSRARSVRLVEDGVGGAGEPLDLLVVERAGPRERRQARGPHDVAGVGAADAGHAAAVAQRRVQHGAVAGQRLAPALGAQPDRLGPEPRERAVGRQAVGVEEVGRRATVRGQLAQAQHLVAPDVHVEGGRAGGACALRPRGDPEAAGLHEVDDEGEIALGADADDLPAPPDALDGPAGQCLERRVGAADRGRVVDPDALDAPAAQGLVETLGERLELRELRHGAPLGAPLYSFG